MAKEAFEYHKMLCDPTFDIADGESLILLEEFFLWVCISAMGVYICQGPKPSTDKAMACASNRLLPRIL